jgi:catechol 2,3-dioxygenase-like lactoylglutathione lyase family enzyme
MCKSRFPRTPSRKLAHSIAAFSSSARSRSPQPLQERGGFWLQVGDRQVHVGTEDGVARHATKAHVAYAVTEIAQWRARLAAAGVELLDGIPIPGRDRFEFRDPFGNRVELIGASAVRTE